MKTGWILLVLASGVTVTLQAAINARMRAFAENPLYSALVSFVVGTLVLALVATAGAMLGQSGNWRGTLAAPWWAWVGGVLGAVYVTVIILAVPRIGTAVSAASLIAGQLAAALVLDHFGVLGLPQRTLTGSKIAGAALLLAALWLIQRD